MAPLRGRGVERDLCSIVVTAAASRPPTNSVVGFGAVPAKVTLQSMQLYKKS